MLKNYLVIGLGRFGSSVARQLTMLGQDVLAIDIDEKRVQNVADEVTHALIVDATVMKNLNSIGIKNFDVAIVAIGEDLVSNVMITLQLKEAGVPRVIAKVANEKQGKVLEKVGADQVIYPERDMAKRMANSLVSTHILDSIELADHRIEEVRAAIYMDNRTLGNLDLRKKYGIAVIAIKKHDSANLLVNPGADTMISKEDVLIVIGKNNLLNKFEKSIQKS